MTDNNVEKFTAIDDDCEDNRCEVCHKNIATYKYKNLQLCKWCVEDFIPKIQG